VIPNTLRAKANARAAILEKNFRLPPLGDVARALAAIVAVVTAAALLFGWLAFSGSRSSAIEGFGSERDCTSLGRAGVQCVRRAASDERSNADAAKGRIARLWDGRAAYAASIRVNEANQQISRRVRMSPAFRRG